MTPLIIPTMSALEDKIAIIHFEATLVIGIVTEEPPATVRLPHFQTHQHRFEFFIISDAATFHPFSPTREGVIGLYPTENFHFSLAPCT